MHWIKITLIPLSPIYILKVLVGQEEAGYIKLKLNETTDDIPGPLKRVLEIYDNEVCKSTKRVLSQCPPLRVSLSDSLVALSELQPGVEEKAVEGGLTKKQVKVCVEQVAENISRIQDTVCLADESMKVTDEQFNKIKAAMMWWKCCQGPFPRFLAILS